MLTKSASSKGRIPWNKGLKGTHFSPKTEFKKGSTPVNKLPLGSMTVRTRRRSGSKPRKFMKVAEPNIWRLQCRLVWESRYGCLRRDDVIHHINGNTLDDRLENIIAIPRSDHPRYHSRWGLKPISSSQLEFYRRRYVDMSEKRLEETEGPKVEDGAVQLELW